MSIGVKFSNQTIWSRTKLLKIAFLKHAFFVQKISSFSEIETNLQNFIYVLPVHIYILILYTSESARSFPGSPAWSGTHWKLRATREERESEISQISQKDLVGETMGPRRKG